MDATCEPNSKTEDTSGHLRIAVEITGDVKGRIEYLFPNDTAIEIVKFMSGMEITGLDDFVTSAMGEVANIISGNAMNNLYERNFVCDIMPPEVSINKQPAQCQSDGVLFETEIGTFCLDLFKKFVSF